ncbi:MAG: AI-2E family transporter [Verrucomicrobiaceae bacterium]|nr:AI-2E family transporter [Verrucomicrobiaceae bacterium]
MRKLPTPFHLNAFWTAVAAVSITVIIAISVGFVYLGTQIIAFLQPILIPFAVAGVLAYLLEPLVARLVRWGLSRQRAVILVFTLFSAVIAGITLLIVPTLVRQGAQFVKEVPVYAEKAKGRVSAFATEWHDTIKKETGIEILDFFGPSTTKKDDASSRQTPATSTPAPAPSATVVQAQPTPPTTGDASTPKDATAPASPAHADAFDPNDLLNGDWLKDAMTNVAPATWSLVRRSVGGFLGVFGFLLSLVIVPLYLYYFLTESAEIREKWTHYLPLRASQFKDEVVGTLSDINRYLIAFFRGQLLVSLINGLATGLGLVIVGLKFGWLIGLSLCALGMIPYLGIILCWVPAVIIASVQGGDGTWITGDPWWVFPLVVTGIFALVQQIDGLFITPKIVGESVGLHPMTVIMSVFLWSLIMGGLLGAILAVPLTASVKVLFQRYIWHARLKSEAAVAPEEPEATPSA